MKTETPSMLIKTATRRSLSQFFLSYGIEMPAAIIVVAEIGLLFTGVVARYAFHKPLIWVDEAASGLFLWLAVLGAIIALSRSEHMRLTFFVNRLSPRVNVQLEVFATVVVAAFCICSIFPAWSYVEEEWFITTPALNIPNSFRVAALAFGIVVMAIISLSRLLNFAVFRDVLVALVSIASVAGGLFLAQPLFEAIGNYSLIIFFLLMLGGCICAGVPIAFAFGIAGLAYLEFAAHRPLIVALSRMDEGMSGIILLSIPLFVILGYLMEATGMARVMVNFLGALLGHVRGGLSYVLLAAMCLVSGISGSKTADMAAVAPVLFPEMKRRGAKPGELIALLSSAGAMSETIPPSIVLLAVGSVAGVSIAALFAGGLLPALFLAVILGVVARLRSSDDDLRGVERASGRRILQTFIVALPALTLPFVIRWAVVEGVATATEVSTIGVVYTLITGIFIYRWFDPKRIYELLVDTAALSGAILLIIGTAHIVAWSLTQSGLSEHIAAAMAQIPGGRYGFLLVTIATFVVLGSVLEGLPAIVLMAPIMFPIAKALGIHEVQYAMVVILAMSVGLFSPPVGVGYYIACAIGRVPPDEAISRMWPYMLALLAGLLVIAAVPWLSIGFL